MATTSVLANLAVQISANTTAFNQSLKDSQNALKGFANNFKNIASAIGVGFGAQQIIDFTTQVAKLGGEMQAVKTAFDRLADSGQLMNELKRITGGTVSELELMKAAVKASNFQIELSQLPKLLEFATLRAQQTGQSVDYLVESIIMGIGRKSPMILDNLGISLVRLREKLKGVGAESATVAQMTKVVGEIAEEELGKMPGFANNAATAIDRLSASWTNLKTTIGQSGALERLFNDLAKGMDQMSGDPLAKTIALLERLNKVEGLGFAGSRYPSINQKTGIFNSFRTIKEEIALLIEENNGLNVSQKDLEERFGISSKRAQEYVDIIKSLNAEFTKTKASRDAAARGEIDPSSGMAAGGESWTGRPVKQKTTEELEAETKALDKLLKDREDAWKRFGISIQAINKANDNDLKRFEKWSVDYLKTQINNFRELGDATSQFGQVFQTNLESIQEITQSRIAAGPILPKMIGTPEDIRKMIDNIILLGGAIQTVNESVESAGSAMESFAENAIANLAELGGMLAAENITFKDFGRAILEAVAEFMQAFGRQLITIGIGKEAFDKLFESVGGGAAAIVAGIALVAAGGAIKGGIQNRMKRQQEMQSVARTNTGMGGRTYGSSIEVTGRLVGSGRDLVAVIDSTNFDNKYRRGG